MNNKPLSLSPSVFNKSSSLTLHSAAPAAHDEGGGGEMSRCSSHAPRQSMRIMCAIVRSSRHQIFPICYRENGTRSALTRAHPPAAAYAGGAAHLTSPRTSSQQHISNNVYCSQGRSICSGKENIAASATHSSRVLARTQSNRSNKKIKKK